MEATLSTRGARPVAVRDAAADGQVSSKERDTLKWVVKDLLVPVESGVVTHGTDQAYITEFEFDVLMDRDAPAEEAFDSFMGLPWKGTGIT